MCGYRASAAAWSSSALPCAISCAASDALTGATPRDAVVTGLQTWAHYPDGDSEVY
jgi:hypothetical protein